MKIDLDHHERTLIANLLRRRAIELQGSAKVTTSSRQTIDLGNEAQFAETLAIRMDDGEELQLKEPTPIKTNPRIDLDQVDPQ